MTKERRQEIYTGFAIHCKETFGLMNMDAAWYHARLLMTIADIDISDLKENSFEKPAIKFKKFNPNLGDLITLEDWKKCVEDGSFIDYDGYGNFATETEVSNIQVCPSDYDWYKGNFNPPDWATHIVWYNR